MWITADTNGQITGRFAQKQEGHNCIEVDKADLDAVTFPKYDRKTNKIVNDAAAQAAAEASHALDTAYAYARARGHAYVQAFSKDPKPNQMDAIGHVLDAILSHFAGDSTALDAIQTKRAEIKAAHPKA